MRSWPRPVRNAAAATLLTAAFGASAAFSVAYARDVNGIESVWLSTGFLIAALLTLDRQWAAVTGLACFGLNLLVCLGAGDTPAAALGFSVITLGEALTAAWLARFACGSSLRLTGVGRMLRLLLMAVAPASAAASLVAAFVWTLFGRSFDGVLATWFYADAIGSAVVVPAVLMIRQRDHSPRRPWREELAIYACVTTLSLAVTLYTRFPLMLTIFPALILIAFRLGQRGASLATLLAMAAGLAGVAAHPMGGLNPQWSLPERLRLLQFLIAMAFFSSLTTAMALSAEARLRQLWAGRSRIARHAEDRARAASKSKGEFLAIIGHEIRTPMNSIVGFAQVLLKRGDLPAVAHRQIDLIARAGVSLMTSVDDSLAFSEMATNPIQLDLQPCTPRAVAEDALAIIGADARAKGLVLDLTMAGGADDARMIDDRRVRQVLLNLLGNAVKFTPDGRVRLDVDPQAGAQAGDGGRLRFTVTDTGIGIPKEKLARLFEQFDRLDSSTLRGFGSGGLGLAISKALVEAMGGEIGVDSGEGRGATFWFEIPAAAAAPARPAEDASAQGLGVRVLLVDDHDTNLELGVTVLRLLGCQVETAQDGQQAVEAARLGGHDIILMDVHMPRMNGLEAAQAIRQLGGQVATTPIIAMSADATPEMVARCYAAGMADALSKPVQIAALHAMMAKWIGRRVDTRAHAA